MLPVFPAIYLLQFINGGSPSLAPAFRPGNKMSEIIFEINFLIPPGPLMGSRKIEIFFFMR